MTGLRRNALDIVKWAYWRHIRRVVARLPPAALPWLAAPLSSVNSLAAPARRRALIAELQASGLLADRNAVSAVREAFRSNLASQIKMSYLARLGRDNVEALLPMQGRDNLDGALERGRGVILLNPHFGPFMMVMPALGHRGYVVNQVALQGEPIIGRRTGFCRLAYQAKYDAIEKNMPVRFINAAESGMALRYVMRALERNEIVLFASTGRGGKAWHGVPFLGRQASFNLTPFKVSERTSSPVLPIFLTNSGPLAKLIVERPLEPGPEASPEKLLDQYAAVLGSYVARYPEHFANFLLSMRLQAWWDDHPFFTDYPSRSEPAGARRKQP